MAERRLSVARVLVTGGRDYADREVVFGVLDELCAEGMTTLIEGGARGADALAREWVTDHLDVHHIREDAKWKTFGRRAGAIRNQYMLDAHWPDLVVAFPGGSGTADMTRRAERAGLPVRRIDV